MIKNALKRSHTLVSLMQGAKRARLKRERSAQIAEYLKSHEVKKLQLGSGRNLLPGWLNTDSALLRAGHVYLDITEKLPFDDNTFDFIFLEHTIEHIHYKDGLLLAREARRILKPGGVLRITTPNLEAYLHLFTVPRSEADMLSLTTLYRDWILPGFYAAKNYIPVSKTPDPAVVLNDVFSNYEHHFVYTFPVLRDVLGAAGFREVIRCEPLVSTHSALMGIETHNDASSVHLTMVLEASK